jgi:hypothetical protein
VNDQQRCCKPEATQVKVNVDGSLLIKMIVQEQQEQYSDTIKASS